MKINSVNDILIEQIFRVSVVCDSYRERRVRVQGRSLELTQKNDFDLFSPLLTSGNCAVLVKLIPRHVECVPLVNLTGSR
jgi:hypothetical protein